MSLERMYGVAGVMGFDMKDVVVLEGWDVKIAGLVDAIGGILYLSLASALKEVHEGKRSRDSVARRVIMQLPSYVMGFTEKEKLCGGLSAHERRLLRRLLVTSIERFMTLYNTRVRMNAIINLDDMIELADNMAVQLVGVDAWPLEDILVNGITKRLEQAEEAVKKAIEEHLCSALGKNPQQA